MRVNGVVKMPRPVETLRLTAENRRTVTKEVTVTVRNQHLERSRPAVIEVLGKEQGLALFRQVRTSNVLYFNHIPFIPGNL